MEHFRQADGWAHAKEILVPGCQEKERWGNHSAGQG